MSFAMNRIHSNFKRQEICIGVLKIYGSFDENRQLTSKNCVGFDDFKGIPSVTNATEAEAISSHILDTTMGLSTDGMTWGFVQITSVLTIVLSSHSLIEAILMSVLFLTISFYFMIQTKDIEGLVLYFSFFALIIIIFLLACITHKLLREFFKKTVYLELIITEQSDLFEKSNESTLIFKARDIKRKSRR